MKQLKFVTLLTFLAFGVLSCSPLQQLQSLTKCQFRLNTIENLNLAGVDVQNIKSLSDVNLLDAGKITLAFTRGKVPLSFKLNLDIKNPNATAAALNQLDWILVVDDTDIVNGVVNERIEVAPNGGVATLPLTLNFDLKETFSGKSKDGLLNLVFNLVGQGNRPSNITLRAKPYVKIGQSNIPYPGYINIKKDFTSGL